MSEHDSQASLFSWLERQRFEGIDLIHAVPNGGARNIIVAVKLKREGVKAGVPDVSWPVARGGFIGLAIEMKHGDGNPTKEQKWRMTKMQQEGWLCCFAWDWMAAARTIQGYAGMVKVEAI